MRKLFPSHYRPTKEEFDVLWKECIFSFDASVLLNIYRYSPKTRDRFFETLEALSDRIWITHQAASEYHKNRLSEISKQQEPYTKLQKLLNERFEALQDSLKETLKKYAKRHSFSAYVDANQITEPIEKLHERLIETLLNASTQYPNQDDYDGFHERLADLFGDKVGEPYSQEALDDVYEKAESRFQSELPPGYLDARGDNKKSPPECYGDVIIWFQLIDRAKSEGKPVILVTDDNKEDWWLKCRGETIGPRPELREEMLVTAGVAFYQYTSERFLDYAGDFLNLPSEPEIIEEAREVRREGEISQRLHEEQQQADITKNSVSGIDPERYRVSDINPNVYRTSGINDILERMRTEGSIGSIVNELQLNSAMRLQEMIRAELAAQEEMIRAASFPEHIQRALREADEYDKSRQKIIEDIARLQRLNDIDPSKF